jgi:hypothetical protein
MKKHVLFGLVLVGLSGAVACSGSEGGGGTTVAEDGGVYGRISFEAGTRRPKTEEDAGPEADAEVPDDASLKDASDAALDPVVLPAIDAGDADPRIVAFCQRTILARCEKPSLYDYCVHSTDFLRSHNTDACRALMDDALACLARPDLTYECPNGPKECAGVVNKWQICQ